MGHPGFFKTYEETYNWVKDNITHPVGNTPINMDKVTIDPNTLEVDIQTIIALNYLKDLEYIPIKMRELIGIIFISFCDNLKSLIGAPDSCYDISISRCPSLHTMEGVPINIDMLCKIEQCRSLVTLYGMGDIQQVDKIVINDCDSLITYAHECNKNGYTYGNAIPIMNDKKIKGYVHYLSKQSRNSQMKALEWMKKYAIDIYECSLLKSPYFIEYAIKQNLDIELSYDVKNIVNVAMNVNHRL